MRDEKYFFETINTICQNSYQEIAQKLSETKSSTVFGFSFEPIIPLELKNEFEVPNIRLLVIVSSNGDGDVQYYYNDQLIMPLDLSLSDKITTLQYLQQCEFQKTNNPKLGFFNDKNKLLN